MRDAQSYANRGVFESKRATCLCDNCPVNLQRIVDAACGSLNRLPPSKVAASSYGSATVGALRFPVVEL